ncbi:MAG: sigma-70 family RNA polymerase sigma factor [Planctomycetes bacterium]|nr:sigma-70 family RNA polymerase sigma factor [Planctomycetota bacterium]
MKLSLASESDQAFLELLDQARQGDQLALGELIDRYRPYLLKIAHDEGDTDLKPKVADSDLVQFTCLDAVRGFGQFRGRTSHEMLGWLRKILIHRLQGVRDHFRADKRPVEVPLPAESGEVESTLSATGSSPSDQAVHREEREVVEIALQALPPDDRRIVEMRQKEAVAFADIARQFHMTEDATRKRWMRAIRVLQDEVRRLYGHSSD